MKEKDCKIRVRFAPSPTGYLHIGGARTCLFNWLYARARCGVFVLRIEDTDQARSESKYLDEIFDSLKWLGLDWDEVYHQSERFEIYRSFAEKLLKEEKAYHPLDGTGAVILKMPRKILKVHDLIHGEIQFDTSLIKDQVLIKSDGSPAYNFACVVDDAQMRISHIIRGDDHISNTPKQVVMYEALGWNVPEFAHIPMILGRGGGRMSKRTGATAITEYRKMGFLSKAVVNYLLLLGWSPGNNQEMVSLKEAVDKFDITRANKTAATFDMDKLLWMNGQYIRSLCLDDLVEHIRPFLVERRLIEEDNFDGNFLKNILKLFRERAATLADLAESLKVFLLKDVEFDSKARAKFLSKDLSAEFSLLRRRFAELASFEAELVEKTFRDTVGQLGVTTKFLIHPLRVALSGRTVGPGMFEFIEALGKTRTLQRLDHVIEIFKKGSS